MYQTFSSNTKTPKIAHHVAHLRGLLTDYMIDAYLIPRSDEYGNEYLPACFERLSFISGFTGSWGLAIVTHEYATLFIDSRYALQAPTETDLSIFKCVCTSDISLKEYFKQTLNTPLKIGYDGKIHTADEIKRFKEYAPCCEFIDISDNLIDVLLKQTPFSDKPLLSFPNSNIIIYPHEYAGYFASEKISLICDTLHACHADSAVITLPESLCWLLNVRANDVPHTPYVLSYGILYKNGSLDWFVGKDRIDNTITHHLPVGTSIFNREAFYPALSALSGVVLNDNTNSPERVLTVLSNTPTITHILNHDDPCLHHKAIKNSIEIVATKQAHIWDGAAVTRFASWLSDNYARGITEIDCVKRLEQYRIETNKLHDISFDTICGSGENGAIIHYRVNEKTNKILTQNTLLLVDSGGQYWGGTTDVTRTFAIGTPTNEMITRYTQVLKGHVALAMAKFPEKTTGNALDSIARMPLWQAGIDFGHGTGHGVGAYLCVHEGPQSISSRSTVALHAGMILSNEPGYYKPKAFGIRIENLEVITPLAVITGNEALMGDKPMMGFETLTLVPYERALINKNLLTDFEITHINHYHHRVLTALMPHMTCQSERIYLSDACRAL